MPVKEHYVRMLLADYARVCRVEGKPDAPENTAWEKKRIEDHFVELFAECERFFAQTADRIGR